MKNADVENLIPFEDLKQTLNQQKREEEFKSYLQKLRPEQMQFEADYLISQLNIQNRSENDDFMMKSTLLLEELSQRATDPSISDNINNFAQNVRSFLERNV